jgi:hypothetical protein
MAKKAKVIGKSQMPLKGGKKAEKQGVKGGKEK